MDEEIPVVICYLKCGIPYSFYSSLFVIRTCVSFAFVYSAERFLPGVHVEYKTANLATTILSSFVRRRSERSSLHDGKLQHAKTCLRISETRSSQDKASESKLRQLGDDGQK